MSSNRRARFLSDAELQAFIGAVRSRNHRNTLRDVALFALLATTGIRPSEALALERSDIHASASPAWISVKRKKKQSPVVDAIQVPATLAADCARFLRSSGAPSVGPVFGIAPRQAQRLFHYYARAAGIGGRVMLYTLRHTAATRVYRLTRDIGAVQALLGHQSPDTSALYAHLSRPIISDALKDIPPVF